MPESSSSTEELPPGHVIVGRVGKPHGLDGDVFVFPETDNPDRFAPGEWVYLGSRRVSIVSSHNADSRLIVRFDVAKSRNEAEAIRGLLVSILEAERRPLEDDEWWPDQLVGLAVIDHTGNRVGTVSGVVEGVAQDRLVVDTGTGTVEVPFVSAVVPVVDTEAGIVGLADIGGLTETL
ncbi:MAG: ribosome maturation factor RimM [Acidimicrobiia bacterium]|nr:ribosome maturation factor RimM [Acidimicrobiia bacterium]